MAHEVVGKCVAYAITEGKFLPEISLDEYKKFSDLFEADLLDALKPENCVAARTSYGGPAFTENSLCVAMKLSQGRKLKLKN